MYLKENLKIFKEKDSKEKFEKFLVEKLEIDGESEGEGILISIDDNIFFGMYVLDMNKFDFVILIVVDEDDSEEINVKKIFEKKIILKSLDFYLVKCRKVDVIEKIKI